MKKNTILSLTSLLLIVAAIIGVVVLVRKIDESFDSFDKSEDSDTTQDNNLPSDSLGNSSGAVDSSAPSDSSGSSVNADKFYIDEASMTGFSTVGGVTYFFKVIAPDLDGNSYCLISDRNVKAYSSYEVNLKYSYDGVSWNSPYRYNEGEINSYFEIDIYPKCYLSYTSVIGCTDPFYVLEDLKQNVFTDTDMFRYTLKDAAG